jgi:hypothetical protein
MGTAMSSLGELSKLVGGQVAVQMQALEAEATREVARRKERVRAERDARDAELAKREVACRTRIPLARAGLARILELGRSQELKRLRRSYQQLGLGPMTFFCASRPSGDDWHTGKVKHGATRDVEYILKADGLLIRAGDGDAVLGTDSYLIPYIGDRYQIEALREQHADKLLSYDDSIERLLERMAQPWPQPWRLVQQWEQRTCAWHPDDVAFDVLVRAADRRKFNYFVAAFVKRTTTEFERRLALR